MAAQLICNQWVAGSTPVTSSKKILRYTVIIVACIVGFLLYHSAAIARKVRQLGRFVSFGTADSHKKIPPETAKIVIWWDFLWRKMEEVSAFTRGKRQYISMQKTLFWAIQCRKVFSSCHQHQ